MIGFFFCVGIFFPALLLVNIFCVDTIQQAINSTFMCGVCWLTTFKASVLYWRNDRIRELFRQHVFLASAARRDALLDLVYINIRLQMALCAIYTTTYAAAVTQTLLSSPADAILPSTHFWPFKFAQKSTAYYSLLCAQFVTGVAIVPWITMSDTSYIAFMNTVVVHISELKERLRNLGKQVDDGENADLRFYKDLVECCKEYECCIR